MRLDCRVEIAIESLGALRLFLQLVTQGVGLRLRVDQACREAFDVGALGVELRLDPSRTAWDFFLNLLRGDLGRGAGRRIQAANELLDVLIGVGRRGPGILYRARGGFEALHEACGVVGRMPLPGWPAAG